MFTKEIIDLDRWCAFMEASTAETEEEDLEDVEMGGCSDSVKLSMRT